MQRVGVGQIFKDCRQAGCTNTIKHKHNQQCFGHLWSRMCVIFLEGLTWPANESGETKPPP